MWLPFKMPPAKMASAKLKWPVVCLPITHLSLITMCIIQNPYGYYACIWSSDILCSMWDPVKTAKACSVWGLFWFDITEAVLAGGPFLLNTVYVAAFVLQVVHVWSVFCQYTLWQLLLLQPFWWLVFPLPYTFFERLILWNTSGDYRWGIVAAGKMPFLLSTPLEAYSYLVLNWW